MKCVICGKRVGGNRILISSGYLCGHCANAYVHGMKDGLKQPIQDLEKTTERLFTEISERLDDMIERLEYISKRDEHDL